MVMDAYTENPDGTRCSCVPGHSDCKKRIDKDSCPSSENITVTWCHGHPRVKCADLSKAMQWIHETKEPPTQTRGFSFVNTAAAL